MRHTERGKVTIPKEVRDVTGIGAGSDVELDGETAAPRQVEVGPNRGGRLASRLRGRGDVAMTTDEIMALTRGD